MNSVWIVEWCDGFSESSIVDVFKTEEAAYECAGSFNDKPKEISQGYRSVSKWLVSEGDKTCE